MPQSGRKVEGTSGGGKPRWWGMRPAQNLKPATYRCPLCDKHLPALSEHVLIWPERDRSQRRHAHTECVLRARKAGRLPTEGEWRAAEKRERAASRIPGETASSRWARLRGRLFGKD